MKKRGPIFILGLLICIFIGILLFPQNARASSYKIQNYQTHVTVNDDGSADVQQKINYDIKGTMHKIDFTQTFDRSVVPNVDSVALQQSNETINLNYGTSRNNSYYSAVDDKTMAIGINAKLTNTSATAIYNYHVDKFVTNYNDTAEINWRVIGKDWEKPIHNIKITYQFPNHSVQKVKTWVHGPTNYDISTVQGKPSQIKIDIKKIDAHDTVNNHLIFPVAFTSNNQNMVAENKRSKILRDEATQIKQQHVKKIVYWAVAIVFSFIILISYYAGIRNIHYHHLKVTNANYIDDWLRRPDVAPSLAKIILTKNITADFSSFVAELLVQVNKNKLAISSSKDSYEIKLLKKPDDPFFLFLINEIGDGKSVTTEKIANYHDMKLYYEFSKWQNRASQGRSKYIDDTNDKAKSRFSNLGLLTTLLAALQFITMPFLAPEYLIGNSIVSAVVIILGWAIFYQITKKISIYTPLGKTEAEKLGKLRHILNNASNFDATKVSDIKLWQDILPYAVAFDVPLNALNELETSIGPSDFHASSLRLYLNPDHNQLNFLTTIGAAFYLNGTLGGNVDSMPGGGIDISGGSGSSTGTGSGEGMS